MVSVANLACSGAGKVPAAGTDGLWPRVLEVDVRVAGDGRYQFDVTISSAYDTPERYADAWRVRGEDGTVYGVRELTHDHASEQPFTRSLAGVDIPDGVSIVVVEGRDQLNGWGGETIQIAVPGRRETG